MHLLWSDERLFLWGGWWFGHKWNIHFLSFDFSEVGRYGWFLRKHLFNLFDWWTTLILRITPFQLFANFTLLAFTDCSRCFNFKFRLLFFGRWFFISLWLADDGAWHWAWWLRLGFLFGIGSWKARYWSNTLWFVLLYLMYFAFLNGYFLFFLWYFTICQEKSLHDVEECVATKQLSSCWTILWSFMHTFSYNI